MLMVLEDFSHQLLHKLPLCFMGLGNHWLCDIMLAGLFSQSTHRNITAVINVLWLNHTVSQARSPRVREGGRDRGGANVERRRGARCYG